MPGACPGQVGCPRQGSPGLGDLKKAAVFVRELLSQRPKGGLGQRGFQHAEGG